MAKRVTGPGGDEQREDVILIDGRPLEPDAEAVARIVEAMERAARGEDPRDVLFRGRQE